MPVTAAMDEVLTTAPGPLGGLEQGAGRADHLEGADDIDGVEPQEIIAVDRIEVGVVGREFGHAGVVEQCVDAAEGFGGGDDGLALGVIGNIALDQNGLGALRLDEPAGFLGLVPCCWRS